MDTRATPSQTVGPFFSIGFDWMRCADLAKGSAGERVTIRGRVLDGDAQPVPDAVLEIWQADAAGRYHHPDGAGQIEATAAFFGFGRVATDEQGQFAFTTIQPGAVTGPDGMPQAPHLQISLFLRGLLQRLATRIYFPGEPLNATDPVLNKVPPARQGTLIARRSSGNDNILKWDVCLQGESETVFFDC